MRARQPGSLPALAPPALPAMRTACRGGRTWLLKRADDFRARWPTWGVRGTGGWVDSSNPEPSRQGQHGRHIATGAPQVCMAHGTSTVGDKHRMKPLCLSGGMCSPARTRCLSPAGGMSTSSLWLSSHAGNQALLSPKSPYPSRRTMPASPIFTKLSAVPCSSTLFLEKRSLSARRTNQALEAGWSAAAAKTSATKDVFNHRR